MNIRDNFLNSNNFKFEEINQNWYNAPLLKLSKVVSNSNLNEKLIENQIFLGLTKEPLIFLNDLKLTDSKINPDFLIFASRHTSKAARPAFLTHVTGNWSSKVEFGGEPNELCLASALLLKAGYVSLLKSPKNKSLLNYSINMEVTHHGPTMLKKPLIELGSSKEEWCIKEAGEFIATSIIKTIENYLDLKKMGNNIIGLGFGGTHYTPNFQKLINVSNIALSFICPKYYIQNLNKEMISKMINNTMENINFFIIDWKGVNSEDKQHLIPILEEFDIPIKKTKDF
jgi:D-aminoacyl-tRNA deacylase